MLPGVRGIHKNNAVQDWNKVMSFAKEEGLEPRPYSADWQIFTVGFRLYSPDDALNDFEGFCNIRDEDTNFLFSKVILRSKSAPSKPCTRKSGFQILIRFSQGQPGKVVRLTLTGSD